MQAWKFVRFAASLNNGSDTMLNLVNHGSSSLNESNLKNKDVVESTIQCKIDQWIHDINFTQIRQELVRI